ncbi:MAG: methionine adenosyltransferase [Bacteroidota bacterium]|nr:methionine adenosyltransferase [Bacteroidota bacterium]
MNTLFTSESVSEGHPDKVSDQISDAILDNYLAFDPESKVACETLVTTNKVIVAGEVKSKAQINIEKIVRETIKKIGYTDPKIKFSADECDVSSLIHSQSEDINRGVEKSVKENQGAGDQGIMFGYATEETKNMIPLTLDLSHKILKELSTIRRQGGKIEYLRPDSKSQVTVEYDRNGIPVSIDTILVSTQHDSFAKDDREMVDKIKKDIVEILLPRVFDNENQNIKSLYNENTKVIVNPTGKFVIGGPHGDTGLTGRKIIVDTYGGWGAHGGGAFSGKDPSKVDRSAAYAARHIAKNLVASGVASKILVQLSYAIGIAEPTSINVNTFGTSKVKLTNSEITEMIYKIFDLRPYSIEKNLSLRNPIYLETSSYGHMGREYKKINKIFLNKNNQEVNHKVDLFTWENLNYVKKINDYLNK